MVEPYQFPVCISHCASVRSFSLIRDAESELSQTIYCIYSDYYVHQQKLLTLVSGTAFKSPIFVVKLSVMIESGRNDEHRQVFYNISLASNIQWVFF